MVVTRGRAGGCGLFWPGHAFVRNAQRVLMSEYGLANTGERILVKESWCVDLQTPDLKRQVWSASPEA